MKFSQRVPVRFSDTDAMGHVNHARLLSYFEEGRVALREKVSDSLRTSPGWILRRIEVDYLGQIKLPAEPVQVDLWVERMGNTSFTLGSEITHDGKVVARSSSVVVAFDYTKQEPRPLSDGERAALSAYELDPNVVTRSAIERGDLS